MSETLLTLCTTERGRSDDLVGGLMSYSLNSLKGGYIGDYLGE